MIGDAINLMLETFQELRRRGDQACLFLETRNGEQFGTLRVKITKSKPGAPNTTARKSKSPSTVRRDQQRMKTFLERKTLQESLGSPSATSTPFSRPGQTSSSQEVQVTMPVTEALDEDSLEVEPQITETEEEKDNDKVTNKASFMSPEQFEKSLEALKKALKNCNITKENEDSNVEQLDDDNDDDNIDAAKIWAKRQKSHVTR